MREILVQSMLQPESRQVASFSVLHDLYRLQILVVGVPRVKFQRIFFSFLLTVAEMKLIPTFFLLLWLTLHGLGSRHQYNTRFMSSSRPQYTSLLSVGMLNRNMCDDPSLVTSLNLAFWLTLMVLTHRCSSFK